MASGVHCNYSAGEEDDQYHANRTLTQRMHLTVIPATTIAPTTLVSHTTSTSHRPHRRPVSKRPTHKPVTLGPFPIDPWRPKTTWVHWALLLMALLGAVSDSGVAVGQRRTRVPSWRWTLTPTTPTHTPLRPTLACRASLAPLHPCLLTTDPTCGQTTSPLPRDPTSGKETPRRMKKAGDYSRGRTPPSTART